MFLQILISGITILLGCILQSRLMTWIPFLTAVPNFMLIITLSLAVLKGRRWGMVVGFLCGILQDTMGGGIIGYYALIYLYIGYFNGLLRHFLSEDQLMVPLALCFADSIVYGLYVFLFSYLIRGNGNVNAYVTNVFMPQFVLTIIVVIFLYGILMKIHEYLELQEKKKELNFG